MGFDDLQTIPPWFWEIISRGQRDPETMRHVLTELSKDDLERFHDSFEWARTELTAPTFRRVHGFSLDEMQEMAAWITSQGREYYRAVYDNPSCMPKWDQVTLDDSFDGLVSEVYSDRFGEDLPYPGD